MSKKLDSLKDQQEKAKQKLRYYQHQEKMLERRIPELTRKARTRRLCTRGGMLESFRICPGETDGDQVVELLKLSFLALLRSYPFEALAQGREHNQI